MGKLRGVKLIASILIILGLASCGGASSTDTTLAKTASATDESLSSSFTYQQIEGNWVSECITAEANSSEIVMLSFLSNDKNQHFYKEASAVFDSPNCSGASSVVAFAGSVKYSGEYVTSICTAEKTDVEISTIIVGDKKFSGEIAQSLLNEVNISNPAFDIACQYRDQLFIGQANQEFDRSSTEKRPTTLNVMVAFNPQALVSAKDEINETVTLKAFYDNFKVRLNSLVK